MVSSRRNVNPVLALRGSRVLKRRGRTLVWVWTEDREGWEKREGMLSCLDSPRSIQEWEEF